MNRETEGKEPVRSPPAAKDQNAYPAPSPGLAPSPADGMDGPASCSPEPNPQLDSSAPHTLTASCVPHTCPICGEPTRRAPDLDTRHTRGWRCRATRSLHFWQARAEALRGWMARRRYAISPVPASDGTEDYPGVSFEDLNRARLEMQADRARWRAEGYDPND